MSQVEVDKVIPQSGTTLTIGDSGDTLTVPSGATLNVAGTLVQSGDSGFTGAVTITTTDNSDTLTLKSTDADANVGPNLILQRDSGSPADGDSIGRIDFDADNDAGQVTSFFSIRSEIEDASDGTEDGQLKIDQMIAGTTATILRFKSTETVFNDDSKDVDFRVESNNNANMLFVDGGNDRVGIGTSSPSEELEVSGAQNTITKSKTTTSTALGGFEAHGSASSYIKVFQHGPSFGGTTFGGVTGNNQSLIEAQAASSVVFSTQGNAGGSNPDFIFAPQRSQKVIIKSDGNVGIGTSSPSLKLEVNGDIKSNGITNRTSLQGVDATPTDNNTYELANGYLNLYRDDTAEVNQIQFGKNGTLAAAFSTGANYLAIKTNGDNERMRIDSDGDVGIGTSSPSVKLQVDTPTQNAHVTNIKISQGGWSNSLNKLKSLAWGDPTTLGAIGLLYDGSKADMKWHSFYNGGYKTETTTIMTLTGTGNLTVSGSISKGSGSFTIDHPLPSKKETHNLVHSFVEAPQADNIYRGKIDLVNGTATINIDTNSAMSDGTFVLLNREIQCFTSNETGWTAVKGSVSGNTLTITAQDNTCDDTISWMVIGERQDQHMIDTDWTDENGKVIVEPLKETETTTP